MTADDKSALDGSLEVHVIGESVGIGDAVTVKTWHYLSGQHLWGAVVSSQRATAIEKHLVGKVNTDVTHRSFVISSVMMSVAFLEALINETYADAAENPEHGLAKSLPEQCRKLMVELWHSQAGRNMAVLDKYQWVLVAAGLPRMDKGQQPYQDTDGLIRLRNALVHYKPEWLTTDVDHDLETRLATRFSRSAMMPPTGRPWWPVAALGAGCAEWAHVTARAFADKWTGLLKIQATYGEEVRAAASSPGADWQPTPSEP